MLYVTYMEIERGGTRNLASVEKKKNIIQNHLCSGQKIHDVWQKVEMTVQALRGALCLWVHKSRLRVPPDGEKMGMRTSRGVLLC